MSEELIVAAKREAARRKTSVSKLVGDYFRVLKVGSSRSLPFQPTALAIPPTTASLVGCLKGAKADQASYIDYLEKKHS